MQKKIIALAVAGLVSGAAFAQSNVTIYGVVDVGVVRASIDGKNSAWGVENGLTAGSRLGFKGEEGLGNGLKAIYTLEYMLQPDENAALGAAASNGWTGTATRQAYAGLSSANYGTVVAGRLQGVGYNFACSYNPVAGGAFDTIGKLGASTLLSCGTAGRTNSAVGYISPNFSGFSFEYNHARVTEEAGQGAGVTDVKDNYANLLGGTYQNGPLKIGAAYVTVSRDASNTGLTNNDIREYGLGAEYDFKVVKLSASYQNNRVDNGNHDSKWGIGAAVPVFQSGSVLLSYARNNMDVNNSDSSSYTLAYTHALSKRTTLYTGYTHVSNDSAAAVGFAQFAVPKADGSASIIAAGIRHSF